MEKVANGVLKLYKTVVMGLFVTILFWLGIFSACSTSYMRADVSELTYFVEDNVWINLAAIVIVIAAAVLLKSIPVVGEYVSCVNKDEDRFLKIRRILLLTGLGIAVFWVLSTQYRPGADQAQVQKAAYMLHIKDYSLFAPDGYLAKYPNQLGLLWFSYLFSLVFGSYNYLVFQLMNAVGVVVIGKTLAEISGHCGCKRTVQLLVILFSILFFPLTMYSSFVYGNVLGLACSLNAIEREILFFKKKRKRDLFLSTILIIFAVQLKSNYLIFLIGMLIYAIVESMMQKKIKWLLISLLFLGCNAAAGTAVMTVSEQVSGYELDQGASPWSWIAMGLQEGKRAPGWYNGYNSHSYKESGYDSAIQEEMAKENIFESIERFAEDKEEALRFFTRKTASQWNNPTFQSFWNVQVRSAGVEQSEWSRDLINGRGAILCAEFLNLLQFIILSGAVLFCVNGREGKNMEQMLVLAMIFIGGFVFHMFWEAKCQYTISYFVLLIPFAAAGYEATAERLVLLDRGKISSWKTLWESALEKQFWVLVFGFILVNLTIILFGGGKMDCLREDTVDYLDYLEEITASPADDYEMEALNDSNDAWIRLVCSKTIGGE